MRVRFGVVAAVAICALSVSPWCAGPDAVAGGGLGQAGLHVLRLRPPPKSMYRQTSLKALGWEPFYPTGIDGTGDMLMFDGCCDVIRYNTVRHTWLPGAAVMGDSDAAPIATQRRFIWILPEVERSGFSRSNPLPQFTGKPEAGVFPHWIDIDGLAPTMNGNAWISGWYRPSHAKGYAAIALLNAQSLEAGPAIRAPDPYPLGVDSIGPDGTVWTFDSWTNCSQGHCVGPRFISYDPAHRRFASYVVPRSVWPRGWRAKRHRRLRNASTVSKTAVAPNGAVWAVIGSEWGQHCPNIPNLRCGGVRLFELQDGRIRSEWIPRLNMSSRANDALGFTAPLIVDRSGDLWLCGPTEAPSVVNSVTWSVTALPLHDGTLTEDQHHNVWYVVKQTGLDYGGC